VFRFPQSVLGAIAGITPARLAPIAEAWSQTEELEMDGWSADEAAQFLAELQSHAQQALNADASLFLWMSL